jgi:hypothetical protein
MTFEDQFFVNLKFSEFTERVLKKLRTMILR